VNWIDELFVSYMVDASDVDKIEASRNELHNLLAKPQLEGIPVLVLGNKRDLPAALDEKEIIERMWVLTCCQFGLLEFVADNALYFYFMSTWVAFCWATSNFALVSFWATA